MARDKRKGRVLHGVLAESGMLKEISVILAASILALVSALDATANEADDEATIQAALLACQFAGSGLGIVADELGQDPTVVDTAEGRRLYIATIDKFVGQWVVMTPELKAVLLTSYGKGIQRQRDDPMRHAKGLTEAEQQKYLNLSWQSASAVAERECVFRMGELNGQGQLGSVVKVPGQ